MLKELFKSNDGNTICIKLDGQFISSPGYWPLLNENGENTEFICIGNKSGLPQDYPEVMKKLKNINKHFKFIFNCQSGPFYEENKQTIYQLFDAVFDLEIRYNVKKSLNCNHSMMVRSMPYQGFFWEAQEPEKMEKTFDFSILTWANDHYAKRWDRGQKIVEFLCEKGLKGIVVNQRGEASGIISDKIMTYINKGLLHVETSHYSEVEFHHLMSHAKVSIFPNNIDAFSKHIIESLLADKPVIFSSDLLLGKEVLHSLGDKAARMIDFENDTDANIRIYDFIKHGNFSISPRKTYLNLYGFEALTANWAKEFNRLFNTSYRQLFFMNHLSRIYENNLI